jgi:hypothetical protein
MTSDGRYKGKGKEREVALDSGDEESRSYTNDYGASGSGSRPLSGSSWSSRPSSSKRTIHPYPLSSTGSGRLRTILSSHTIGLSGKKRILQLVLALSIPVLGLLLANEFRISSHRTRLLDSLPDETRVQEWEALDLDTPPCELVNLRRGYEKKRRRELWEKKRETGSYVPILPDGGQMDWLDEDEERLQEEMVDWWPSWWGSSDVGGRSPYDHTPKAVAGGTEKKRVLFLTSESDYS